MSRQITRRLLTACFGLFFVASIALVALDGPDTNIQKPGHRA